MGAPDVVVHTKDSIDDKCPKKIVDIDTALVLTQHRWFHWRLLIIGGFGFLATGSEFTLHAYILPLAKCDLQIDAAKMGVINAVFLAGSLISSLFWGIAADAWGRRKVLWAAMVLEGLATVVASWSVNYQMFTVIRFFSGFLCGSGATILLSYVGEFCCDKTRPRNVCMLGFAWTMTWMLLPGLAALVLPLSFELDAGFVTYRSWRLFVALVGVPNIIAGASLYLFLPESPKYFFAKGEEERAISILQMMFAKNTGQLPKDYPVEHLGTGSDYDNTRQKKIKDSSVGALCKTMFSQMGQVLSPPILWNTLLSCSVYVCGMFGIYGLGLWLPSLFDRFEDFYQAHPNDTVSLCELTRPNLDFELIDNSTMTVSDCGMEAPINLAVFTNTFIIGAGCFVGNIIATYMATKIAVRTLTACLVSIAGACVFIIYFVRSPVAVVAVSAIFMGAGNAGLSVHNTCAINLFPTSIRGMGICISFFCGRVSAVLSSLIFGMLIDIYCEVPIFLVGSIVLLGSFFALMIPKSSQKAQE